MCTLRWVFFTMFFFISVKSQQIDWDRINSNNVFSLIAVQNQDLVASSDIIQMGNGNHAELSINAKTDIAVRQSGDYNALYFVNSFSEAEIKTAITTQGNNNIIDITGSNRISENLQIHVKGDNKTIFMRNY
ncbi:hypothetical protein [Chryseobacterium mucoviscidosis]|uniref:Uncharacterized protein n=1 Tax=Chryseobacterium mucoviscidosis TaxID=1945581 RepID=A0A202BRV0_9FLAO|nr:hypothetical protein [Chryseobacterium mucoviscidosis]OVE54180.1 hypothetical protein B0E34_19260 [Chryseobacterium mucoviscidosis]